jgi:hypothetical protein
MRKTAAVLCLLIGIVMIVLGREWGYNRNYTWKGNLQYTQRNTEEIPRSFEQVFENYVTDQWPFVIFAGGILVVGSTLVLVKCWFGSVKQ